MGTTSGVESWNGAAASEAAGQFTMIADQFLAVLMRRNQQVQQAMADYQASGISDVYWAKEQRWQRAATHARDTVTALCTSLTAAADTAADTSTRASGIANKVN